MKRKRMMKFALPMALMGTVFLSGCVWHDYNSPKIDGVVTHQGQKLAGVKVSLAYYDRDIETTTTDAQGHFSFKAQGEWNVLIPIGPQDRLIRWSVIIKPEGVEEITGYEGGRVGGVFSGYSSGDRMTLLCDIALAHESSDDPQQTQVCRAQDL